MTRGLRNTVRHAFAAALALVLFAVGPGALVPEASAGAGATFRVGEGLDEIPEQAPLLFNGDVLGSTPVLPPSVILARAGRLSAGALGVKPEAEGLGAGRPVAERWAVGAADACVPTPRRVLLCTYRL